MATNNLVAGTAFTVNTPDKGATGTVKCYVHQSGSPLTTFRPANAVEAVQWAFSLITTKAELDALVDGIDGLVESATVRIGKPKPTVQVTAPALTPAPAAKVDDKPLTAPAPAPVATTGPAFDIMSVKGMTTDRVAQWMLHKWTLADMQFNLKAGGISPDKMPTLPAFVASLVAAHKGVKPAPVVAPAPAPVVKPVVVAPVAPVVKPVAPTNTALPATYQDVVALKGDALSALAAKLGIALTATGKGSYIVNCKTVWAGIQSAPVVKAATPAPVVAPAAPVAPKAATFKAGTLLVADGKGGVRIATSEDVTVWMDTVMGVVS